MIYLLAESLDPKSLADYANSGGVIGILLFILVGGARGWWVFGWQHRELKEKCEKVEEQNVNWMRLAMKSTKILETAVGDDSLDKRTS